MTLTTGTRLGSYEVLAPVGAGGMGEVYRARDTKLGREVAIKVLPDAFAKDPERLARFEREAQLLASLNHPNIAAIHGLEEHNGRRYLVLEYVPGETLAEQIARGPLAMEDTLTICKQIAEALEAAHEKGIIHRDLKPANVKITPEGKVKVLDFGLAKDVAVAAASDEISKSPTITSPAYTRAGMILGTAAYMSPEQARGKTVDKRTDIWAFGCVLYETLSGKKAFGGENTSDMIAEILKSDVDWNKLPANTPPKIRDLVHRCLRKEPGQRLRDIGDARIEIEEALANPAASAFTPTAGLAVSARLFSRVAVVLVAALLLAIVFGFWLGGTKQAGGKLLRVTVPLPEPSRLGTGDLPLVAISPDGTKLVYVAIAGGSTQLFLRPLDRMEATPITGTDGADGPFFSPDGQWIGFFADKKLKKAALSGGPAVALADIPAPRGGSWVTQESIITTRDAGSGLMRVPAAGGTPEVLTKPDAAEGETSHRFPAMLPDGKNILFTLKTTRIRSFDEAQIAVLSLKTGQYKLLIDGGTNPRFVPTGHIVYAREGNLMAAPFDVKRLEVTGPPTTILQGVVEQPATGSASFSVSTDGTMAFVPGGEVTSDLNLVWVDRKGEAHDIAAPAHHYVVPAISPDGRRIVATVMAAYDDVWTYDIARGALTRITFNSDANAVGSTWTPDGKRIAYAVLASGHTDLLWKAADGTGSAEQLFTDPGMLTPTAVTPDGKMLAFDKSSPKTGTDIWLISLDGKKEAKPLMETPFDEMSAHFSPDGRWMAYASNESGRFEIYVRPFGGSEGKWQVSTEGGTEPAWSPNGKELFFRNGDKMMAAAIDTASGFNAGTPQQLFEGPYERAPVGSDYAVAPDGRFLVIRGPKSSPRQINIVLNWFRELERKK